MDDLDFETFASNLNGEDNIPISSNGVYDYPNQEVIVPTNGSITMQNVDYPILGVSMETGEQQMMQPGGEYYFENTNNVHEIPQFQYGGRFLRNFLNDNVTQGDFVPRVNEEVRILTPQEQLRTALPNIDKRKTDIGSLRNQYSDYDLYNLQKVMNSTVSSNTPQVVSDRIQVAKDIYNNKFGGEKYKNAYMQLNYNNNLENEYYTNFSKLDDTSLLNKYRNYSKNQGTVYLHEMNALGKLLDERRINPINERKLQIPNRYQDGGIVEDDRLLKPEDYGILNFDDYSKNLTDDVQNFYKDMINAPWYSERLDNNGYDPDDAVFARGETIKDMKFNQINKIPKHLKKQNVVSSYYDRDRNTVNFYDEDRYKTNSSTGSIISHEVGHGASQYINEPEKIKLRNSIIAQNIDAHDGDPVEIKSDIDALRYMMYKQNNFDPKTGKYKTEDGKFDKSLIEKLKNEFVPRRLNGVIGEDNLKILLDTIALNKGNSLQQYLG